MTKTIMAIGAHADDIEIWAGGTILKYFDKGYKIVYVMATNNMSGCWSDPQPDGGVKVSRPGTVEMMKRRKAEAAAAARVVGTHPIHLDHPQRHYNGADGKQVELRYGAGLPETVPEDVPSILTAHESEDARKVIIDIIMLADPEWIITHGVDNLKVEHIATCLLVARSYREAVSRGYGGGLMFWMEGQQWDIGQTSRLWDTFVDTTGYEEKKNKWMACHGCQIPEGSQFFQSDFLRHRALGKMCGCASAEVFTLVEKGRAGLLA